MATAWVRLLAGCSLLLAAVSAASAESSGNGSTRNKVYFDPGAINASPEAFNPAIALPEIPDYTPPGSWPLNTARPAELHLGPWRPQPPWANNEKKEKEDDSAGRIPPNGGSFGIETERKFNAGKSIPSSQYFDSVMERASKKPFVGLSIEAPFNSEDR